MRLKVYIAGPISKGSLAENINQGSRAFLELLRAGFAPFCPMWSAFAEGCAAFSNTAQHPYAFAHTLPASTGHADWMAADLPWVAVSDAVLRLPGESVGADEEVAFAHERLIPVFYSVKDVVGWAALDQAPTGGPVS